MVFTDDETNLLHSYTRKQALEDKVLYDFTEFSKEFGFVIPLAITGNLYATYINPSPGLEQMGQSLEGRLADVLNVLFYTIKSTKDESSSLIKFKVLFQMEDGDNIKMETVLLWALIGPGDEGEPVLTIMLPDDY